MKPRKLSRREVIVYTAVILFGIGIDQMTKWLAVRFLAPVKTFPIIENALHLTYVENRGAAFGMLADNRWVFLVISSILIACLIPYLYLGMAEGRLSSVSVAMILSGGIGNMIDRIALGYVVDFIDVRLIRFAVFNGADSFVCVGAALLVLSLLLSIIDESKKASANKRQ